PPLHRALHQEHCLSPSTSVSSPASSSSTSYSRGLGHKARQGSCRKELQGGHQVWKVGAQFVKFYAPWFGVEQAEKYADNDKVIIAKVDSTQNEVRITAD
ncbi:hypothetical protein PFISCL1PPCAC_12769, partial [Pristionchus fissidentatus]